MDFVNSVFPTRTVHPRCQQINTCPPPDPDIMRPFGIMIITAMLLVPVRGDAGNGHDPEFTPPANKHLVIAAAIVAAAPCVFMSGGGERKRHGRAVHMTSED